MAPASDGTPRGGFSTTSEYDPDGRLLSSRSTNPDGSFSATTRTYDSQGRLLKETWTPSNSRPTEKIYVYDSAGRLLSLADNGEYSSRSNFHYDEQGGKTRIQHFDAKPQESGRLTAVGSGGFPLQELESGVGLPPGGSVTTIHNDHDQPTEARVYDAEGQLALRIIASYDANGRVTEQKQILEGPELMIPAEDRKKILAQSGASAAELRSHLASLLGGPKGFFTRSSHYQYDAQGRITEIRQQISSLEQLTKFSYNDHGDITEETRSSKGQMGTASATDPGIPFPEQPTEHIRYQYLYDMFGNWTEQTTTTTAGSFKTSATTTRILTYY